jgi:hypothetical protein
MNRPKDILPGDFVQDGLALQRWPHQTMACWKRAKHGLIVREIARHCFVDQAFVVVEEINLESLQSTVEPYRLGPFLSAGWMLATISEWNSAVRKCQARADRERYGIPVYAADLAWRVGCIVRATKTKLVSANGLAFCRQTGKARGACTVRIKDSSLAEVEAFLAGREKVDIVAERKPSRSRRSAT